MSKEIKHLNIVKNFMKQDNFFSSSDYSLINRGYENNHHFAIKLNKHANKHIYSFEQFIRPEISELSKSFMIIENTKGIVVKVTKNEKIENYITDHIKHDEGYIALNKVAKLYKKLFYHIRHTGRYVFHHEVDVLSDIQLYLPLTSKEKRDYSQFTCSINMDKCCLIQVILGEDLENSIKKYDYTLKFNGKLLNIYLIQSNTIKELISNIESVFKQELMDNELKGYSDQDYNNFILLTEMECIA